MKNDLTIVMYHYVRDLKHSRYPNIKGLGLDLFKKQVHFFKERYNFVSCEEVLEAKYAQKKLPENSILLTFDDGYIDHYTNVFPILKENNVQGFFAVPGKLIVENKVLDVNKIHFILASTPIKKILELVFYYLDYYRGREYKIPSNKYLYEKLAKSNRFDSAEIIFIKRLLQVELEKKLRNQIVDRLFKDCIGIEEHIFSKELYMDYKQIELMKREGMYFGVHGYNHNWFASLDDNEITIDIKKALEVFDTVLDKNAWIFCYPYGSYNESVVQISQKLGAVAGFTTEVHVANLDHDDIMKLPRMDTNDFLDFKK